MNEFSFLKDLRLKYSLDHAGDDCAVLPMRAETDLLITSDMLVEDVDFRLEWTVPEFLGHKSLAVSLSDVAAMGGTPTWSLLSLAIPEKLWNSDFLDRFYEGWFALARKYDVELVGGDISRSPGGLVIDSTVGGKVTGGTAFLRSTAKPGDLIYVSGSLGGAAGGLRLLESGTRHSPQLPADTVSLVEKQLKPLPELIVSNSLQDLKIVTAGIDLSDGLSSDLGHMCDQSRVGAIIDAEFIPIDPALSAQFSPEEAWDMALNGGEDFRLLFTVSPEASGSLEGLRVTLIGEITPESGKILLKQRDKLILINPEGFRHF